MLYAILNGITKNSGDFYLYKKYIQIISFIVEHSLPSHYENQLV